MHSELNFSGYTARDEYHKRERVVSAALTLYAARLQGGKIAGSAYNPIKQDADWIEEALEIPAGHRPGRDQRPQHYSLHGYQSPIFRPAIINN